MRLITFLETTGYQEEGERDYPNPLPSVGDEDPRFENWFDRYDAAVLSKFRRVPNNPDEYVAEVDGVWKRYGKSVDVPIDQVVASETHLSKSGLAGGKNKPPRIIKIDDILFIIDGNHRVVRAHLNGNPTVRAMVLDVDAIEQRGMWSEINEIRRRAGLPLLEMSYQDAVNVFARLGVDVRNMEQDEITKVHRRLIQKQHPDVGGSLEVAQDLNAARDVLRKAPQPARGPSGFKDYKEGKPAWVWAGYSGGAPPQSHIRRSNYTDLNYIKKRMWELSGKSDKTYTVWQYDGEFFRGVFSVYGSPKIFNEMAKAMRIWGQHGNPYYTRAVFVNEPDNGRDLKLIYLDGKFLGDDPFVLYHNSFNMNPSNDPEFMRDLPAELERVNQKLKAGRSEKSE